MPYHREDLEALFRIYHFNFLHDDEHLQYLTEQYIVNGHYLCQATKLFLPNSVTEHSDRDILTHLVKRIPIYFGTPRNDLFSWESVKNLLGYDHNHLQMDPKLISQIRYAISGPINIMSTPTLLETRAWVTHLWGVNFETTQTEDYRVLYQEKSELDIDAYLDRQLDLFNLIFQSAKYAGKQEMAHRVKIQMPMIGLGQFLNALKAKEKQVCQMLFAEALGQVIKKYPEIQLKLCVFQPDQFSPDCLSLLTKLATQHSNLVLGLGKTDGNMLLDIENQDTKRDKPLICLINAWDPRAFIGNGGSMDKTIDGFLVANAGGYHNYCRNTSYLHNAFFCPQVLNPKKWILVN